MRDAVSELTCARTQAPAAIDDQEAVESTLSRRRQIQAERVRLLFEQAPVAIFATLLVAALMAFAHWDVIPKPVVAGWFLAHLVVNTIRLSLALAYKAKPRMGAEAGRWGAWYIAGSALSGLAWGSAVLLMLFSPSAEYQYLVALCVVGLIAGALAIHYAVFWAYAAFSVPALVPVALWFLGRGGEIYALMGGLGILLLGVLLVTAWRLNANLSRSLNLSLANSELANTVSVAWEEAIKINRELEREVSARRRIEQWLKREKDRAQITLHSIGDAVITADGSCRVDYLNAVAERLTGWSLEDAHGQPLERVFRLRESPGRQRPQTDPVRDCLSEAVTNGFGDGVLRQRDDIELPVQHSWAPIRDLHGNVSGSVLVFREIGGQPPAAQPPSFGDSHDPPTGLMNRLGFAQRLQDAVHRARFENQEHVLLSLDLETYERVTDAHGDSAGDELLLRFGQLLQRQARNADATARIGVAGFGMLLESCPLARAQPIVEKLHQAIAEFRFAWADEEIPVTVAVDVTRVSADTDVTSLLEPRNGS